MGRRQILSECRCLWPSTARYESSKNPLSPQRICRASDTPGGIVSTAHLSSENLQHHPALLGFCVLGFLCPPGPSTLPQTQYPLFHKGEHNSMVCVHTHREAGLRYVIPQLCLPGRHLHFQRVAFFFPWCFECTSVACEVSAEKPNGDLTGVP